MKKFIKCVAGIMAATITIGCGLLATGPVVNAAGITIDSNNFPDEEFRNYIKATYDTNSDGNLSESEAGLVNVIEGMEFFSSGMIHSVNGIEFFPNLSELNLADIELTGIDVSKNVKLEKLFIPYSSVSNIDLTNNSNLLNLDVSGNQLSSLDISNCPKILSVGVSEN